MSDLVVLHPYDPATVGAPWQAPTWRVLRRLRRRWPVQDIACSEPATYDTALRAAWGTADVLVVEHDIVPRDTHLAALAACPHPLCAWVYPYWVPAVIDTLDALLVAWPHLRRPMPPAVLVPWLLRPAPRWRWVADAYTPAGRVPVPRGAPWCDAAGLGLFRVRRTFARPTAPTWPAGTWRTLDERVMAWLHALGQPIHLHWARPWPAHHHDCPCHPRAATNPLSRLLVVP